MSAAFIHADPNLITDLPIIERLLKNSPYFTTTLTTLGCNVGGLKRIPHGKRAEWFYRMDEVLMWMPSHHDALLIALRGDKAQWAYLITGPSKWHELGIYKTDATKAFSYWEPGIDIIQYKSNTKDFYSLRNKLFLTAKELEDEY